MNSNYSFSIVCGILAAANLQLNFYGMFVFWLAASLGFGWYGDWTKRKENETNNQLN